MIRRLPLLGALCAVSMAQTHPVVHGPSASPALAASGEQVVGVSVRGSVEITTIEGGPVQDRSQVVVFLEATGASQQPAPQSKGRAIVQVGGAFQPSVMPVLRGTSIDFPNDDRIFHNIFSLSPARSFDLGVYRAGETRSVDFPAAGLVKVFCNIHPDMAASILVLNAPYFTASDSLGRYEITDVPPGTYTLRTWHEFGGETRQVVRVNSTDLVVPSISVQEDRVVMPHLNKFGRRYGGKYGG